MRTPPLHASLRPGAADPDHDRGGLRQVIQSHVRPFVECHSGKGGAWFTASSTRATTRTRSLPTGKRWDAFKPNAALSRAGRFFLRAAWDPGGHVCERVRVRSARAEKCQRRLHLGTRSIKRFSWCWKTPQRTGGLYYVLHRISGLRHETGDPMAPVERYCRRQRTGPGLENSLKSVAQIDAIGRCDFPGRRLGAAPPIGWPGYWARWLITANAAHGYLAR